MKNFRTSSSWIFLAVLITAGCNNKTISGPSSDTTRPGGTTIGNTESGPRTQDEPVAPLTLDEMKTAEEVAKEEASKQDPAQADKASEENEAEETNVMECEAKATEAIPGETKNQGLIFWTHIKGSCNEGAYAFEIKSWGPVFRFSDEEIKIKCHGKTLTSMDDWVGAYYGFHAAAGVVKGGSFGKYARRTGGWFSTARCYVMGHTDLSEDHYSFGFELGYGRLTISKTGSEPNPAPTPVPTPSPLPTEQP